MDKKKLLFIEDSVSYHERLRSILNVVVENDIPAIYQIDFRSVLNLKKLLSIIARLVPYKPNISNLSRQIGVTWETLLRYLYYLDKAQIVKWLGKDTPLVVRIALLIWPYFSSISPVA